MIDPTRVNIIKLFLGKYVFRGWLWMAHCPFGNEISAIQTSALFVRILGIRCDFWYKMASTTAKDNLWRMLEPFVKYVFT